MKKQSRDSHSGFTASEGIKIIIMSFGGFILLTFTTARCIITLHNHQSFTGILDPAYISYFIGLTLLLWAANLASGKTFAYSAIILIAAAPLCSSAVMHLVR